MYQEKFEENMYRPVHVTLSITQLSEKYGRHENNEIRVRMKNLNNDYQAEDNVLRRCSRSLKRIKNRKKFIHLFTRRFLIKLVLNSGIENIKILSKAEDLLRTNSAQNGRGLKKKRKSKGQERRKMTKYFS